MTAEQIIPPITDPHGKYWNQPHRRYIEMDDTHALMSEQTFKELCDYSGSLPTGAYEGKMWRSKIRDRWFLCWYDIDADDNRYLIVKSREILVV